MAANRVGRTHADEVHSSDLGTSPEHGGNLQKRQARVTVKYNRKELQRRLDVEKWIDDCLNELYLGKVSAVVPSWTITRATQKPRLYLCPVLFLIPIVPTLLLNGLDN